MKEYTRLVDSPIPKRRGVINAFRLTTGHVLLRVKHEVESSPTGFVGGTVMLTLDEARECAAALLEIADTPKNPGD